MKRTFILITLFLYSFLYGQVANNLSVDENLIIDNLIERSVSDIFESFQEVPIKNFTSEQGSKIEGFGMYFKRDIDDKVFANIKKKFTKTRFRVYEKERVNELLQEQSIQMEDFYSKKGRLKIGQLTQWKGFLIGNVSSSMENKFGKKSFYIVISCDFINLETGELIWSDSFTNFHKVKLPLNLYFVIIFLILLIAWIANFLSKGVRTNMIFGISFILFLGYSIWFFII